MLFPNVFALNELLLLLLIIIDTIFPFTIEGINIY